MKLVSIIIPVYNGERYIKQCIDSVLKQTYKNIEILLIDDGSTDKSASICDRYSRKHSHIYTFHILNCGPSGARNIGIQNCNGDLIYFLDVDDNIETHTIELLVEQYEKHDVELVIGDFYRITEGVKSASGNALSFDSDTLLDQKSILKYVRQYCKIPYRYILFNHIWNRLYSADIIKNNNLLFNVDLRNLEDVDFNFKYLNYVKSAFFKNVPLYNYTIRKTSQSFIIGDDLNDVTKYPSTFETIKMFLRNRSLDETDITKEVGQLCISYTIIILIRLCGNWKFRNSYKTYCNVASIVNSSEVRQNLIFYLPTVDDIKFIHILMRYKLNFLIMLTCRRRYKTHRKFKAKTDYSQVCYNLLMKRRGKTNAIDRPY